jgi:small subunit ribosomal protein S17
MAEETEDTRTEETADAPATEASSTPDAPAAEPQAQLTPKERRSARRARSRARRRASTASTPEEQQAERDADRKRKAAARRRRRLSEREAAKATASERQTTPPREHGPGTQKTRQGIVVSDKADKTITVRIDTSRRHRRYQKIVRTSTTLHAHDETNNANAGDTVVIRESRPLSRSKRWRLVEVIERAK